GNLWYVGIAPLALATVALVLRARPMVWFWTGLALFAVFVAYGIGPFLYVRWLPGLNATLPNRIGFLLVAAIAVLSGLGFDALAHLAARRRAWAVALVGLLGACIGVVLVIATRAWAAGATDA